MSTRTTRRTESAARREDLSGSGPVVGDRQLGRFPGVTGAFALFGEVLLVGMLIAAGGILVITFPVALAAGTRHLRRYLAAEASTMRMFWTDYAHALLGGVVVGGLATSMIVTLIIDIDVAGSGALPGGQFIVTVGWVLLAGVSALLLASAGSWSPESGWRTALRTGWRRLVGDPVAATYFVAASTFAVVATWALPPLLVPALGCLALAVVAVPERPRRRR